MTVFDIANLSCRYWWVMLGVMMLALSGGGAEEKK